MSYLGLYVKPPRARSYNWCQQMTDFKVKCIKFNLSWGSGPELGSGAELTAVIQLY